MITRNDPGTIWLGGPRTEIGDVAASQTITPGHLVLRFNNAGIWRYKKHDDTTAEHDSPRAVATEQSMLNKTVDDDYAAGDLMEVSLGAGGTSFWMWIASGQTIVYGDPLESAGDGTLRKAASGVVMFAALESKTSVALTRLRVEVV